MAELLHSTRRLRHSWRVALRLARRDAVRHRLRSLLAVALVALPITAVISIAAVLQPATPSREQALAGIPDGAQAQLTATAIRPDGDPFPQLPEGASGWFDDLDQVPVSAQELAALLPAGNELSAYWNSPTLIATTALQLAPGQQQPAGTGVGDIEQLPLDTITTATLTEAETAALRLLLPQLTAGTAPVSPNEMVVTTALAERLGLGIGDTLAWVAPPFNGGYSSVDGRLAEVVSGSQRGYRVVGLVENDAESLGWAPAGWISALVEADPAGVDRRWLVLGSEAVTWQQAKATNELQAFAVSRHVLEHYPPADERYPVAVDAGALQEQLVVLTIGALLGALLVLFLVTPAFTVAAEQQRRSLALAAVAGAAAADLRRTITAQGLVVGLAGGSLGALLGLGAGAAGRALRYPDAQPLANFPWWALLAGIVVAAALGVLATLWPARAVARLAPVEALKDRAREPRAPRSWWPLAVGAGLLASALASAALSLQLPLPGWDADSGLPERFSVPAQHTALFLTALLLAIAGTLLLLGPLIDGASLRAARAPAVLRLALRDAAGHRSRFLPAAAAVLAAVCLASFQLVVVGSQTANERDLHTEVVTGGRLVLGVQTPVSEPFDRLVLAAGIEALAEQFPVTGHEPLYSVASDSARHIEPLLPEGRSCPVGEAADTASATRPGTALHCVPYDYAYMPSYSVGWWAGTQWMVLSGDALRASGFEGAQEAAAVLDAGGALVHNAAYLSESGTVRLAVGDDMFPASSDPAARTIEVPGVFLRGFGAEVALAPQTAAQLGLETDYVGEFVITEGELSQAQLAAARATTDAATSGLTATVTPSLPYPWGMHLWLAGAAALAAVAVLAAVIALQLARTQSLRDFGTLAAVGAPPGFLRRFTLAQAAVVLGIGVPLGLALGLGLGVYRIAWQRRLQASGAWLDTVPLWWLQLGLAVTVIGAGLLAAVLIGRAPRSLQRRALD